MNPADYRTIAEVCQEWGISRRYFYKLRAAGLIAVAYLDRKPVVHRSVSKPAPRQAGRPKKAP